MKKIIAVLLAILIILGIATVVLAMDKDNTGDVLLIAPASTNEIKVQQNGSYIDFKDNEGRVVNPQIINNRTMVPFRKIFNAFGVLDENISWDGETKKIVAKKDNLEIELQIDNTTAKKTISGDRSEIKLDSAPVIIEGRTLVPVRFIAESMNKKVGWDAINRTVIIIDTSKIADDLEKSIPKYLELANAEVELPDTYALKMNLNGKIEYQSKDNKSDNSTLNLSGTINLNKTIDTLAMNIDTKISGKGELYNALKDNKATNFTFNIILNDNKMYIKSTSLNAKTNGKWAVTEDDFIRNLLKSSEGEQVSFSNIFEVNEETLNLNTYQTMQTIANVLKTLLNDKNIEITEKGMTKTYAITMKLSDFVNILKSEGIESKWDGIDASIKLTSKYKKQSLQTSSCDLDFSYEEGNEIIKGTMTAEGKLANNSNISIPDVSQVVDAKEIQ